MQHLHYGINFLSKFAIARRLPLLRGTLRHIIIPCLILDPHLAVFPPSDCSCLRFGPPADRACIINAFVVLFCIPLTSKGSSVLEDGGTGGRKPTEWANRSFLENSHLVGEHHPRFLDEWTLRAIFGCPVFFYSSNLPE